MTQSARLGLPFILPNQAQKHITHNEAVAALDTLVQPVVEARTLLAPPASPLEGEAWLVPATATGVWAGHGDQLAAWSNGDWAFHDPATGWQVVDRSDMTLLVFTGSAWVPLAALGQLGINATADSTNRLAVSADASLFTHAGAGHQLKLNKAGAAETGSLLFQSSWSGRAEMGLMGDDHWRIKVSADGTSWVDALAIDPAGAARFGGAVLPALDNAQTLGDAGARWSAVWSTTGTIQTSDRRDKTDIAPTDLGLDFILALNPVRYRWQEGTRTHHGLIAQEVAEVLAGRDFAGHVLFDPTDPQSRQGLRYDAFIAPLIASIQTLAARVSALEP
jgi:hypothetical protein